MAKYLTKWFKQGFISAHDLKSQSMGWGRHGNRSQSQLLHCIPSREAERWILVLSIHLGPQPCCHISFRPLCSSPLVSLWLLILMPFCSSLGWEARAVLRFGGSLEPDGGHTDTIIVPHTRLHLSALLQPVFRSPRNSEHSLSLLFFVSDATDGCPMSHKVCK